jgi:predicted enzyme related to lactoylglutathione lyase
MARNPVNWFEIYVDDMQRAKSFYQTVLDTTLNKLDVGDMPLEMWTFPNEQGNPGAGGALVHMDGFKAGGNSTLVYFSCEDCATEESRVESAGGKVFKNKFSIGEYGFIALAYDTEGNMFGLHSMK